MDGRDIKILEEMFSRLVNALKEIEKAIYQLKDNVDKLEKYNYLENTDSWDRW